MLNAQYAERARCAAPPQYNNNLFRKTKTTLTYRPKQPPVRPMGTRAERDFQPARADIGNRLMAGGQNRRAASTEIDGVWARDATRRHVGHSHDFHVFFLENNDKK